MNDADVLIVGAGPAGVAAAVMAASLRLHAIVVEREQVGGRLRHIGALENVPGGWTTGQQLGDALAADLERLRADGRCKLLNASATAVRLNEEQAELVLKDGRTLTANTIVVATGVSAMSPAAAPWIRADTDFNPPMLWRARPADLGGIPYVLGADRPLGTWLRAHPDTKTILRVLCPPGDDYKAAEIVHDSRVHLLKIGKVEATQQTADRGWLLETENRSGQRAAYAATSVLNNLGNSPAALPGLTRGEDDYCPPDVQHPRLRIAGDLRGARCQRIVTAQGSGAEAVLSAYYRDRAGVC